MNPAILTAIIQGARVRGSSSFVGSLSSGKWQDAAKKGGQWSAAAMRAAQERFRDRVASGETISPAELADAPAGHVPEEMGQNRWQARMDRIVQSSRRATYDRYSAFRNRSATGGSGGSSGAGSGGGDRGGFSVSPPPGSGPGGISGGGSGADGGSGPGLSDAIRAVVKATTVVVGGTKALELFNRGIISVHQNLSQFDGRLAQAYASLEVADIRRGTERAGQIGGSLANLIAAQNELRDTTYGIGTEVSGILTDLATHATRALNYVNKLTGAGELVVDLLSSIRSIIETSGDDPVNTPWQNFFNDVANGTFEGKVPEFPVRGQGGTRQERTERSRRASALMGRRGGA